MLRPADGTPPKEGHNNAETLIQTDRPGRFCLGPAACGGESKQAAGGGAGGNTTLVYCSEGSPGGFYPGQYTDGTTFDAAAHTIYNGLIQFKIGPPTSNPHWSKAGEFWKTAKPTPFKLRPDVKFHTTDYFTPTRSFNADDVVFLPSGACSIKTTPTTKPTRPDFPTQPTWA